MTALKRLFLLSLFFPLVLTINPIQQSVQAVSETMTPYDSNIIHSQGAITEVMDRDSQDTDVFGYTRSGPTAYSWVDTSGGTDTGINCTTVKSTGPISIGFNFDYYQHEYSELYISCFGYLSFNDAELERIQPHEIPSPDSPNDVIAPYWTKAESITYVHYQTIGSSPNRQFVVEWNKFTTDSGDNQYTFEVILHENGDITFQYETIDYSGSGYATYAGIENSKGDDGLKSYYHAQDETPSNTAEKFIRPADHANPILTSKSQGNVVVADETIKYTINIYNYGTLGTDDYTITTDSEWPVALFEDDGVTPLENNPINLDQEESYSFVAAITAPSTVNPTETNIAEITATSGKTPNISNSVQIVNSFPAPFVQYMDDKNNDGQQSTIFVLPENQTKVDFPGEGIEGDIAVIELPNHNLFHIWSERNCNDDFCVRFDDIIKYAILDPTGNEVLGSTVLVDATGMEEDVIDNSTDIAVTPDGDIGILWHREIFDSVNRISNNNIFFTILSQDGTSFILEPQNLTNNEDYCSFYNSSCTDQYNPMLASTPDGNFFMEWRRNPDRDNVFKIFEDTTGTLSPTYNLINADPGGGYSGDFTLTGLNNNRYFLAWNYEEEVCVEGDCNQETELRYIVVNSDASIEKPITSIPGLSLSDPDSTQLSNGNIIVAHDNPPDTSYILFDSSTYEPITPMTLITGQSNYWSPGVVSVLQGPYGTAVLTWQHYPEEKDNWHLFYTLIDGDGTVKTPPIIFYETDYDSSNYYSNITSEYGRGSTTLDYDYIPNFTSNPVTSANLNTDYIYHITTDDGNFPDDTLTVSWVTKPDWLSFTDNGDGTATLSGVSNNTGSFTVELAVEDLNMNRSTQTFTIEVSGSANAYFFPILFR